MPTSHRPPGCEHGRSDPHMLYSHPILSHFGSLEMDSPAAVSNAHFEPVSIGMVPDPLAVAPVDYDGPNASAINNHVHQFMPASVSDYVPNSSVLNGDGSSGFAQSSEDMHHSQQSFYASSPQLATEVPGSLGDFRFPARYERTMETVPAAARVTENGNQTPQGFVHGAHPAMQPIVQQMSEQTPFEMTGVIVPELANHTITHRAAQQPLQMVGHMTPDAMLNLLDVNVEDNADMIQLEEISTNLVANSAALRSCTASPMQPMVRAQINAPAYLRGIQPLEVAAREAETRAMMAEEQTAPGRNVYTFGMYSAGVVHAPGMPARRLDGSAVAPAGDGSVVAAQAGNAAYARDLRGSGAMKKSRRSRGKRLKTQTASRFCHICLRRGERVGLLKCSNLQKGTCRKVTCEKCFVEYGWNWHAACSDPQWSCSHCRNACPDRAQCFIYKRTNDRRHQALMQRKEQEAAHKKSQAENVMAMLEQQKTQQFGQVTPAEHGYVNRGGNMETVGRNQAANQD